MINLKTWITDFLSIIAEATQNRVLIKQAAELWRAVRTENPRWKKLNYKYLHEKHLRLQWLEDHRAIFLALQQKDSELARKRPETSGKQQNELIKIFKQDASISDFDDFSSLVNLH